MFNCENFIVIIKLTPRLATVIDYLVWTFGISCRRIGHGSAVMGRQLVGLDVFEQSRLPLVLVESVDADFVDRHLIHERPHHVVDDGE